MSDAADVTAYDFQLRSLDGYLLPLASYRGRPMVIVNTASRCGFTPQYADLQTLWTEFKDRGLIVLGVPCNDFGRQEPGDAAMIAAFCQRAFGVNFPMAAKVHVRGNDTHPLYRWLGKQGGALSKPRWNFHKYLIDRDGRMRDWFACVTSPRSKRFRSAIEGLF